MLIHMYIYIYMYICVCLNAVISIVIIVIAIIITMIIYLYIIYLHIYIFIYWWIYVAGRYPYTFGILAYIHPYKLVVGFYPKCLSNKIRVVLTTSSCSGGHGWFRLVTYCACVCLSMDLSKCMCKHWCSNDYHCSLSYAGTLAFLRWW